MPCTFLLWHKSVLNAGSKGRMQKTCNHQEPNMDLLLQLRQYQSSRINTQNWVCSHQDNSPWCNFPELKSLKLGRDKTYNVWCDYVARNTRWETQSIPDPAHLPEECWALYSTFPNLHKLMGRLNESIYYSNYCQMEFRGFLELQVHSPSTWLLGYAQEYEHHSCLLPPTMLHPAQHVNHSAWHWLFLPFLLNLEE